MNIIHHRLFIALFTLSVLHGCASVTPLKIETATFQAATDIEANLPRIELTGDILYRLLIAEVALIQGHYSLAAELYTDLAYKTRDPRLAERATRLALFARRDDAVLGVAQLWVELMPEDRAAREALVSAYIRNGQDEAVQPHLDYLLLHHDEQAGQAFRSIAALLQQEGEVETAFKAMQRFTSRHQDAAEALHAFAYIAVQAQQPDVARQALDQALALRPKWLAAMTLYSRVILMQGNSYEAAVYMAGLLKQFPDADDVRSAYARLLVENRQLVEALEQYKLIAKKNPANENAIFVAGMLSLQLNLVAEAQDWLERLLALDKRQDQAHFFLGQIADLQNQVDVAIAHYSAVLNGEHYYDARLRLAILVARQGDLDKARDYLLTLRLQAALDKQAQLFATEADLLVDAGQVEAAMALYGSALQTYPDDEDLLYGRALLADQQGNIELAEQDLRHLIAVSPNNASAMNALGFTLADRTQRYEEAYELISQALTLRPDSPAILDSMGWILYRLGRLDEAVTYLRRSLEQRNDHEVAAHLGEVLWMQGAHEDARSVWNNALDSFPGDKLILDVMQRLQR